MAGFLPASAYLCAEVAQRERARYATRFWHPVAPLASLPAGTALATQVLELPVLLTHPPGEEPKAFLNRCPHRGVALAPPGVPAPRGPARGEAALPCRRLVCPYHGWTYDLRGELLAAAREAEFLDSFDRRAWPLQPLSCQARGSMLWVAIGPDPLPLEAQLDLVLAEAGDHFDQPRVPLADVQQELACNWKIAHDNTLDDYHVAIAHPTTLHREQGPVRAYRHRLGRHANLLATPSAEGEFLTFGLPPWTHLLLWPDGRLAVIQFPPLAVNRCLMQVWLLGDPRHLPNAEALTAQLQRFLAEDRALVEAAQRGYATGLVPGPAHRLEQRILHQQALYTALMEEGLPT